MDWKRAAVAYVLFALLVAVIQELAPVALPKEGDWKLKLGADAIFPALLIALLWVIGYFRPKKEQSSQVVDDA